MFTPDQHFLTLVKVETPHTVCVKGVTGKQSLERVLRFPLRERSYNGSRPTRRITSICQIKVVFNHDTQICTPVKLGHFDRVIWGDMWFHFGVC